MCNKTKRFFLEQWRTLANKQRPGQDKENNKVFNTLLYLIYNASEYTKKMSRIYSNLEIG